jgi:hypothetical protein
VSEWLESYQYLSLNALVLPSELHPLVGRPGQAVTRGGVLQSPGDDCNWRSLASRRPTLHKPPRPHQIRHSNVRWPIRRLFVSDFQAARSEARPAQA